MLTGSRWRATTSLELLPEAAGRARGGGRLSASSDGLPRKPDSMKAVGEIRQISRSQTLPDELARRMARLLLRRADVTNQ